MLANILKLKASYKVKADSDKAAAKAADRAAKNKIALANIAATENEKAVNFEATIAKKAATANEKAAILGLQPRKQRISKSVKKRLPHAHP